MLFNFSLIFHTLPHKIISEATVYQFSAQITSAECSPRDIGTPLESVGAVIIKRNHDTEGDSQTIIKENEEDKNKGTEEMELEGDGIGELGLYGPQLAQGYYR